MNSVILIPCRLESTRFPNKPLALILGKPMIQWVYEAAEKSDACREGLRRGGDEGDLVSSSCLMGGTG